MPEEERPMKIPDDQELIEALKGNGLDDDRSVDLLERWTLGQEALSDEPEYRTENLDLKKARLFLAAGLLDDAWQYFDDAMEKTWQEDRLDEYERIKAELAKAQADRQS